MRLVSNYRAIIRVRQVTSRISLTSTRSHGAESLGANAVLNVRFAPSMVMQGSAEMLAYGTAVVLQAE